MEKVKKKQQEDLHQDGLYTRLYTGPSCPICNGSQHWRYGVVGSGVLNDDVVYIIAECQCCQTAFAMEAGPNDLGVFFDTLDKMF